MLLVAALESHIDRNSPKRGYDQGYVEGARYTAKAFLWTNAYLAPLVLTNQSVVLENCLFITLVESSPALVIEPGTSNVTIHGGRIYGGY